MATEVDLFEAVEAADVSRVADIVAQGEIDFSQTDRRVGLAPVRGTCVVTWFILLPASCADWPDSAPVGRDDSRCEGV